MTSSDRAPVGADQDAELLRATERERLRALVSGDVERASQLHSEDFQLINPLGGVVSKQQYLGGISSGQIHYLYWEPESIAVRVYGGVAVIRYRSQLEIRAGPSYPAPALLAYRSLRAPRHAVAGGLVACNRCR